MAMELSIKLIEGEDLSIPLETGNPMYVVGPNGSGKSALIQHAVRVLGANNVRRISAHRQTWLQSSAIDMTAQSRKQFDEQLVGQEPNPVYRWREYNSGARLSSVLFDLIAMDDDQARRIRDLHFARDTEGIERIINCERPIFERMNDLMQVAGLEVRIENSQSGEILARHREANEPYSMAQMSDGERNAVILAANVLTVAPGTVLLIDEPERHLHRSIIEPLLSALFAQRPDCPFVVSTHEVALPLANPEAPVLILNSCRWNGDRAEAWDAKLLQGNVGLPEDVKRVILGSRRKILFVEGDSNSLDIQLYNALFPEISVIPVGSSDKVIDAVIGLRESTNLHEVGAFGIVDGDNRDEKDKAGLEQRGIHALKLYSVESLYFCLDAIKAVATWQAQSLGEDANEILERIQKGALQALRAQGLAGSMAARHCERRVREDIQYQMPTWKTILQGQHFSPAVDIDSWFQEELNHFNGLLESGEVEQIIARYPIRDSEVIEAIVKPLQLNRYTYRKTLLSRIRENPDLANVLRCKIEPLSSLIYPLT